VDWRIVAQGEEHMTDITLPRAELERALDALKSSDESGCDEFLSIIDALEERLAQPEQEPTGCSCRWDSEGDRVVTCARHEGWLEVVAEWADRARDAEKKLKALNTSPPQRKPPQFPTMLRKMWSGAEVQKWINKNWEQA
jgi:hypothetical protein